MSDTVAPPAGADSNPAVQDRGAGYLFGPVVDFICLGGGSLLFMFPIVLLASPELRPFLVLFGILISHFVNNPHFMHSYQIFYDNFHEKAFGDSYSTNLRTRYIIAGIVVPAAMLVFFLSGFLNNDPKLVGLGANAMFFLVGWHYVKQGYGMLIVESVLKRRFFNDFEKNWFRYNGFAVWLFSWIYGNITLSKYSLFGLEYYSFDFPDWLAFVAGAVMAVTTTMVVFLVLRKRLRDGARLPLNGLLAYATSSYVWLIAVNLEPMTVLLVPAFHSLQYLAVVWRYELNKERADAGPDVPDLVLFGGALRLSRAVLRLMRFVMIGTVIGFVAFWIAPILLSAGVPYDKEAFGPGLFVFIFFIFINVHHYFLDNVMWRKENPDIRRHLFTPR
jgi:hypothetical protein